MIGFKNFFQKKRNIFLIFLILISFQAIFSFLSPSYDNTWYWKTTGELDFYQGYVFDNFDNSFIEKAYPLIENYRLHLDAGGYLLLAHDFPQHYFKGNVTFLTRPLYPILVNIVARPLHLFSNSYSLTFGAGLLVNFFLFLFTVWLFYLLVKKFISSRVAFLSSLLLIFSPLAHIWLIQPETNIFGIFTIIASLYLFSNYLDKPSFRKLVIFSLAIGLLFLGKKLFAITIFFILLALFFRRFKEGAIFLVVHLLPLAFWSLWISRVWGLEVYVDEVSYFNFGIVLLNLFSWPWYQTLQFFMDSLPKFFSSLVHGFLLIPVIFAAIGYKRLTLLKKNIIVSGFILSFFILFFGSNIYLPRWGFWLFPLIYPLAVLGIDTVADILKKHERYKGWLAPAFYILAYGLIILISSLNIYKFIYYG